MSSAQQRPGAGQPGFSVRPVRSPADAAAAMRVVMTIWGGPAGIDANTLVALGHSDNYVVLAELGEEVVGVGIGFCGPPTTRALHSHIVGATVPGAGRVIKNHQRDWSAERDLRTITWTFDPLVARNAWFNFGVLGARAEEYLVDHYGPMNDGLNAGQPSDRLLVSWPVAAAAPDTATGVTSAVSSSSGTADRIDVPVDLEQLRRDDPAAALDWRLRVREEFRIQFASGHGVLGFARAGSGRGGSYLLGPTAGSVPSYHPACGLDEGSDPADHHPADQPWQDRP